MLDSAEPQPILLSREPIHIPSNQKDVVGLVVGLGQRERQEQQNYAQEVRKAPLLRLHSSVGVTRKLQLQD